MKDKVMKYERITIWLEPQQKKYVLNCNGSASRVVRILIKQHLEEQEYMSKIKSPLNKEIKNDMKEQKSWVPTEERLHRIEEALVNLAGDVEGTQGVDLLKETNKILFPSLYVKDKRYFIHSTGEIRHCQAPHSPKHQLRESWFNSFETKEQAERAVLELKKLLCKS